MSNSTRNARFFNYPTPRANDAAYQAPPPPKNPVIKGSALHYLSNLYVQMQMKMRMQKKMQMQMQMQMQMR